MIEEWRQIPGYEGLYEVSSFGRVRSLDRYVKSSYGAYRLHKGKVLSPGKKSDGYLVVCLLERMFRVHRLVAETFIPNPLGLPQVNHKDEDKTNNRVENLEWCDAKYNNNYGTSRIRARNTMIKNGFCSGLSKKEVRRLYVKKYREQHLDDMKENNRNYYQEHKEEIKERTRKYYQEHKEEYNEWKKEYRRKKKEDDTK